MRDTNSDAGAVRAASGSACRSGRPTPLVNSVSPVNTATSFKTYDVLSFVWPGV